MESGTIYDDGDTGVVGEGDDDADVGEVRWGGVWDWEPEMGPRKEAGGGAGGAPADDLYLTSLLSMSSCGRVCLASEWL